jgi:hypothetical protein
MSSNLLPTATVSTPPSGAAHATPAASEREKPKPTRKRVIDAVRLKDHAAAHERWADHKGKRGDRIGAMAARYDAAQMHERADKDLTRWAYTTRNREQPGNGGELVPLPEPEDSYCRDIKRMTVEELPDVLVHQASSDAMNLAVKADVLPAALEMANSIKAKNRPEKLLAHQAVTMHSLAMNLAARAQNEINRLERYSATGASLAQYQATSVEASRLTNATARAMGAFNDALLTLQRLRMGGKQIVQVQHVTVKEGGQAVVAQSMKTGKRAKGRGAPKARGSIENNDPAPYAQASVARDRLAQGNGSGAFGPALYCPVQAFQTALQGAGGEAMDGLPEAWRAWRRADGRAERRLSTRTMYYRGQGA